MKLIIDIPEEDYKFIKDLQFYCSGRRSGKTIENHVIDAIRTGIPYEERPQGEWIFGSTLGHGWMKCSNCCVSQSEQTLCWSYCPNCGADMKGGAE